MSSSVSSTTEKKMSALSKKPRITSSRSESWPRTRSLSSTSSRYRENDCWRWTRPTPSMDAAIRSRTPIAAIHADAVTDANASEESSFETMDQRVPGTAATHPTTFWPR